MTARIARLLTRVLFVTLLATRLSALTVLPTKRIVLTRDHPEDYIESPGYPDETYPPDTQQYYVVKVELGNKVWQDSARIHVTLEIFLMQKSAMCSKDGLDIVDRTGEVRAYCGPQSGRNFLTGDSLIVMRMYTDDQVQDRGFRVKVKMYHSPCGDLIRNQTSGIIQSPDYPYAYGAHRLCLWRIEVPRGKIIELTFTGFFDIRSEDHQTCLMDYLQITRTGNFSTDTARYCGDLRPTTILSTTNRMEVKFVTDCCEEGRGFKILFRVINALDATIPPATNRYRPRPCSRVECGVPNLVTARIVGGAEFGPHKYPWLVAILDYYQDYICTGSLISRRFVLTAAHCCENQKKLYVKVGVHNLEHEPSIDVRRCAIHPGYKKRNLINDVAVIELQRPVTFNSFVRPICLPLEHYDKTDAEGIIAGWGRESYGGKDRVTPKDAMVPFVSNGECVQKYGAVILETNICAGGRKEDTCQGDSGGPLMSTVEVPGKYVQVGIVSTGIDCGRIGFPGIYTRVSTYHDFVYGVTREQWCSIKSR